MYEYVRTPTGWVLCWGGAALHHGPAKASIPAVPTRDGREAEGKGRPADEVLATLAV